MNMFTPTDDLTTFDDLQAITFRQPGALAGVPIGRALCRRLTAGETASGGGAFAAGDVKWRIAQVDLAEQPQIGAIITDPAGMQWTVLHLELPVTTGSWVCWCHKVG